MEEEPTSNQEEQIAQDAPVAQEDAVIINPPPAAEAVVPTPIADNVAGLVEDWFRTYIHNSPYSQDTELLNRKTAAKDELVKQIRDAIGAA